MIKKVRKRDNSIVEFQKEKIFNAIKKAVDAVGGEVQIDTVVDKVIDNLLAKERKNRIPTVEEIQDIVERVLIELKYFDVARAYILYREKRRELRETKVILTGVEDELKLSVNGLKVLERRYLQKNDKGAVIETPKDLFERVAQNVAKIDRKYDHTADVNTTAKAFYEMMATFRFMPNSPTLMNAGTSIGQLSACFVLPVDDDMASIFDAVKNAALIHQSGGGTGFSFSRLRPQFDVVRTTQGVASGPVSFMRVFDVSTDVIKQGGKRRGANMGVLEVTHPDILDFISVKEKEGLLTNFNISVALSDKFMESIEGGSIDLINPRTGQPVRRVRSKIIFDMLVYNAWKSGDPGIIFLDRINRDNPTPKLGNIEATNPCGEQPLLPYEACNLGSINLGKFVKDDGKIDWQGIQETVIHAVHFLDNVIDLSKFPIKKIEEVVKGNRKIGLGIMGWADMLLKLGIPYNSDDALKLAHKIMKFISGTAHEQSQSLAKKRGEFPNCRNSIYDKQYRNATLTTIAPTGSISIIAGCSSGIEPLFAIAFIRNVMEGTELLEVNETFKKLMVDKGLYSDDLVREILKSGTLQHIKIIPDDIKKVFVTAHEISPEWHIRMQAAFQHYTDNAVSKTVNLPNNATPSDVEKIYLLGWKLGVKGITVYRDVSKSDQPMQINIDVADGLKKVDSEYCGDSACAVCNL